MRVTNIPYGNDLYQQKNGNKCKTIRRSGVRPHMSNTPKKYTLLFYDMIDILSYIEYNNKCFVSNQQTTLKSHNKGKRIFVCVCVKRERIVLI